MNPITYSWHPSQTSAQCQNDASAQQRYETELRRYYQRTRENPPEPVGLSVQVASDIRARVEQQEVLL